MRDRTDAGPPLSAVTPLSRLIGNLLTPLFNPPLWRKHHAVLILWPRSPGHRCRVWHWRGHCPAACKQRPECRRLRCQRRQCAARHQPSSTPRAATPWPTWPTWHASMRSRLPWPARSIRSATFILPSTTPVSVATRARRENWTLPPGAG